MMAQAILYLRYGLLSGEQCIYIAEENTKETVLSSLSDGGIDVERAVKERRLLLWNRTDYKPAGPFDRDVMFNFVQGSVDKAVAEGFSGLRLAVEMTWAPKSGVTLTTRQGSPDNENCEEEMIAVRLRAHRRVAIR